MQLLSHDGERLMFHLDSDEVVILRQLVDLGLTAQGGARRLSRAPDALPPGALEDFKASMQASVDAGRAFLARVFAPGGGYLRDPAPGARGFGLALSRPDVEQLLQALNEVKLAHWERLGCPEELDTPDDVTPLTLSSMVVMDLANQVQMLLLRAIDAQD